MRFLHGTDGSVLSIDVIFLDVGNAKELHIEGSLEINRPHVTDVRSAQAISNHVGIPLIRLLYLREIQ